VPDPNETSRTVGRNESDVLCGTSADTERIEVRWRRIDGPSVREIVGEGVGFLNEAPAEVATSCKFLGN
jgi:hypothetical protein